MFDYNSQVLFSFQSLSYRQEISKQLTKITKHSHIAVIVNAQRERERERERENAINCTIVVSNSIIIQLILTSKIPFNHKHEITPATNNKSINETSSLRKNEKRKLEERIELKGQSTTMNYL